MQNRSCAEEAQTTCLATLITRSCFICFFFFFPPSVTPKRVGVAFSFPQLRTKKNEKWKTAVIAVAGWQTEKKKSKKKKKKGALEQKYEIYIYLYSKKDIVNQGRIFYYRVSVGVSVSLLSFFFFFFLSRSARQTESAKAGESRCQNLYSDLNLGSPFFVPFSSFFDDLCLLFTRRKRLNTMRKRTT